MNELLKFMALVITTLVVGITYPVITLTILTALMFALFVTVSILVMVDMLTMGDGW